MHTALACVLVASSGALGGWDCCWFAPRNKSQSCVGRHRNDLVARVCARASFVIEITDQQIIISAARSIVIIISSDHPSSLVLGWLLRCFGPSCPSLLSFCLLAVRR